MSCGVVCDVMCAMLPLKRAVSCRGKSSSASLRRCVWVCAAHERGSGDGHMITVRQWKCGAVKHVRPGPAAGGLGGAAAGR
jgi:hypothetical protein